MVRMEIACIIMVLFIAVIYFQGKRKMTYNHVLFGLIEVFTVINLTFDAITLYTVNHLGEVSLFLNRLCHGIFIGSLVIVLFLTFQYVMLLINENSLEQQRLKMYWSIPLVLSLIGVIFFPLYYKETPKGNYSYGPAANMAYLSVGLYLVISIFFLVSKYKQINPKKKNVVLVALAIEAAVSIYQAIVPTSLISGMGITLINLAFFLTVESPDVHLIEQLKEEKERADKANEAKSNFIASVSHEIRSPINAILGMNEMILKESKEEDIIEYATDVSSATQAMQSIINDILDLSKIESGKMEIIKVEYELSRVIKDVYNMLYLKADAKNLKFEIYVEPSIPKRLYGDDVRIRQILTNLLTNAVKYTNEGSILLSVKGSSNGNDAILKFQVTDTGIGIKEEDLGKLFSKYERIEEKRNRNIEGTGLGMSITSQLISMMDSELEVESVYGKGSTFHFILKQEIIDSTPVGDINISERKKILREKRESKMSDTLKPEEKGTLKGKVLVVDDDMMNRKVFCRLLKNTSLEITEADSGKKCLELVKQEKFHIIFMDHMMPEMDGVETFDAMKTLEGNKSLQAPVIILTGNVMDGAKEEYLAKGFQDFLAKPIIPENLMKILSEKLQGGDSL